MRDPSNRLGEVIAGRFRLERLLGVGGMGEVYVAIQEPLGRRVALKLIKASLAQESGAASRFEREARSLAALHHPHIVTLFDFGQTPEGELFMAMEFLPGVSLRDRLKRSGAMPVPEALRIIDEVCAALEAAHRGGIVHRDLKPDNIMLVDLTASGGPRDLVKVLDFGIARLRDTADDARQITQTGHIVGTPGYIAPEMITEGVLDDPRSDLYAVGVILFELLSGRTLFEAPTPVMLIMKHAQEVPPRLVNAMSGRRIHMAIDELVQRLLSKRPADRPHTAADVRVAIASLPAQALMPVTDPLAAADTALRFTPPPPATPPPSSPMSPMSPSRPLHDLPPEMATVDSSRPRMRGDTAPTMPQPAAATSPPATTTPAPHPLRAAGLAFAVVLGLGLLFLLGRSAFTGAGTGTTTTPTTVTVVPPAVVPPPVAQPPVAPPPVVSPPVAPPIAPPVAVPPAPPPTTTTRAVRKPPPPPPTTTKPHYVPDMTPLGSERK